MVSSSGGEGIESTGWLIEEHERWRMHHAGSDVEAPFLAAAKATDGKATGQAAAHELGLLVSQAHGLKPLRHRTTT